MTINEYIWQLRYLAKGFEYYIVLLFIIAIIIGLFDAMSVSLLYPMLSVGFQIKTDSFPMYDLITVVSSVIPIGSPFVHLGFLFIILTGSSLCLQLIYWKIAFIFQKSVIIGIKKAIFFKIDTNDYKFFVDSKQGDLLNLFNQSPYYIQQTYDKLLGFCTDLVSSLMVIIMLFLISPAGLMLVSVGGVIFYFVIHAIGKNISEKLGYLQIASGQSENKVINEYITGAKPIRALNTSEHWKNQYDSALKVYWDRFAEFNFIQRIPIIAINSLFYMGIGIIILIIYIYYAENFLTIIPVLGTFVAGMMKILPKLMNMGTYKLDLKTALPHVNAVYEHLQDTRYNAISPGNQVCQEIESDIILQDISFSYGHGKILNQVTMKIVKGSMSALVGHSGSGKSTIANLLLRLYDPTEGEIIINGKNLKEYETGSYRDLIGYVSQDPFIFNDTIRENITFGGNFSDNEIIIAAKLAYAHEFIMELPHGYDTLVGDQGITLSGGEKQRIVIARAMIRHPELLILDEATSALDNISEDLVQKAIDQVAKECTTLVIAHRLSTIRNADTIVVIEKGKIVEEGNHDDLLRKQGKYYQMNKMSERKQDELLLT
jgi:ATP-binding cassette subfamily B protein/subfamily B ATP-binding cassette protein MsbA